MTYHNVLGGQVGSGAKRIAFIDHTTKMGGGQVYLLRQLSKLDRTNFHPIVVCPTDGPLADLVRQEGIDMHILPINPGLIELKKEDVFGDPVSMVLNPFRFAGAVVRLAAWFRKMKINLVHLNSMKAGFYGGVAGRLAGLPVVWDFKDIISEDFFPTFNRGLVVKIGNTFVSRLVANSQAIRNAYVAQGGRAEKVDVIINGIELDQFHPSFSGGSVRSELGLTGDTPVVSIFSRLDRWKGHTYFLQAAACVASEFPNAHFLVVGALTFDDPAYAEDLHALTRELDLEDRVTYLGFRQDIADLMAASDIIVHASILPEPLGLTPMEAQAAGKPVVAVGAGGVLETVVDGETGLLVPARDAGAMADALLDLLRRPDRQRRMGEAGRARAETLFDLNVNARRVQDVYKSLLEAT